MMDVYIKSKRLKIEESTTNLELELKFLQETCTHPQHQVFREAKADTGNFDPSENSYWSDCRCVCCGKRWEEPQ